MSWRDEKPAVSYEKAWDATEEVRQVKLTQEYQDGTHKEIKVPIDDGSKGPEYLIMVVMDEFDDAAEELDYTNDELFINFARVLKGNTKFLWQNVIDGLTDAQKTTARFKQAKKELIQAIVGPNQRNIMKSWLQNKCGKHYSVDVETCVFVFAPGFRNESRQPTGSGHICYTGDSSPSEQQ